MSPVMAWPQRGGVAWSLPGGGHSRLTVRQAVRFAAECTRTGDVETARVIARAITRAWLQRHAGGAR